MKKLFLLITMMLMGGLIFAQSYGERGAVHYVETKLERFGVALNAGMVVIEDDSCAAYILTAKRAANDSMNTAFRKSEYCVLAGGSGGGTSTNISAGNGMDFTTISNGTGTITLGTPSAVTGTSTNSASSTTHTHAVTTGAVVNDATNLVDANDVYDFVIGLGYTTNTGTVTSVAAGNGLDFTTITTTGSVTLGTPSAVTGTSTNSVSAGTHTHAVTTGAVADNQSNLVDANDVYDFVIGLGYDNYNYWTVSDDVPNTENITTTSSVKFVGAGIASTAYNSTNNTMTITATEVDGSTSNELQNLSWDGANGHIELSDGTDADVGMFATASTTYGFVPGSNGNTTGYFLQGDGTWALPGNQHQVFSASAGQTNFACTEFTLTDEYVVFVNGSLNISGHSRSTNTVVFTSGLKENSEVVVFR